MEKPLYALRERLLRAGVAPRHVRRYLRELTDHLADLRLEEASAGKSEAEAEAAALARLGGMDDLAKAMIEQRQFQSWSARAPWAVYGLAPLVALAAVWFVSLFLLWSGWQVFLPRADSPFGARFGVHHIFELANVYFQFARMLYFTAPLLVGLGIGLIAARQRLKVIWPTVGLIVTAWIGGMGKVQVSRTLVPGGLGHIRMDFVVGSIVHGVPSSLLGALMTLVLTVPFYYFWLVQKTHSRSA